MKCDVVGIGHFRGKDKDDALRRALDFEMVGKRGLGLPDQKRHKKADGKKG